MSEWEALALCASSSVLPNASGRPASLCQITLSGESEPPEWIQLVPIAKAIKALDGRKFSNTRPERVIEAFNKYPYDIPVDWEHSSELRAPKGQESPAAGWIKELAARDGYLWGRVEWTPKGAASLRSLEYRYVSPAFLHDSSGEVKELVSAGLTNRPALVLKALAHQQGDTMNPELLKALGLPADATEAEALAAAQAMAASNTKLKTDVGLLEGIQQKADETQAELATARAKLSEAEKNAIPSLDKFVPRSDYDVAIASVQRLEAEKAAAAKTARDKEIEVEIDAALKAGKITPATKDYHVATCSKEGGLELFREFVKTAPVVAGDTNLDGKKPPKEGGAPKATAEQLAIAANCGLTEEEYLKSLGN